MIKISTRHYNYLDRYVEAFR